MSRKKEDRAKLAIARFETSSPGRRGAGRGAERASGIDLDLAEQALPGLEILLLVSFPELGEQTRCIRHDITPVSQTGHLAAGFRGVDLKRP